MATAKVEEVLRDHADALMSIPGVAGVGQGVCDGRPCIKVFLREQTREAETQIPAVLDGCRVIVEVTGEITASRKS